ncbi:type II CRISPR RNA-guided endonuclease Cas9 [Flavobacterium zepuense]|uniref:CRISPR-associated endonuclease Cas9 n=1 Tax=Flavobacterium zepuense TaxID=2593302 RepID=A0A552V008_9FLAO|nr:type II CRISPR RNA-guided endonuclease Cas9 [Flavobacterium zepuense]TRW23804.1 type II CRISPR RNA-guided endonuclease Cas9 [Flavobacterium zepuense]
MRNILGLDVGTNSVGWALVNSDLENRSGRIKGAGSRVIPMSQDVLGKFDSGVSISQTAERTKYRGARRLVQRFLLRRERLHRVLNILNFLPSHYSEAIDFDKHFGQFKPEREEKLSSYKDMTGKNQFLFKESYNEMLTLFRAQFPDLKKVPYDLTIYYLRKKALTERISGQELVWILLNFNQKRGYYQLRGEEEEENKGKLVRFYSLMVTNVIDTNEKNKAGQTLFNIVLENGWDFIKPSSSNVEWAGKVKEFIITTEVEDDGITPKKDKEGREKRSFRAPLENDWTLIKTKTEQDIKSSGKTPGHYIFDALLKDPAQKINGKLVRTIERYYYKEELKQILETQSSFHQELSDEKLYGDCINELYKRNEAHKNNIKSRGFAYLFLEDIIFYQRPLKSKISLISDCSFEQHPLKDKKGNLVRNENGQPILKPLKCIARSNPIFQEFRLLQFVKNLSIYERELTNDGKIEFDVDVTAKYLPTVNDLEELFLWLNDKAEISQKQLLSYPRFKLKEEKFRWNFPEDKIYPCNETRSQFLRAASKIEALDESFFSSGIMQDLWHILYSVTDKIEIEKAIGSFAKKHNLPEDFIPAFSKLKPYKKEYGAYSEKATKKLLQLMRFGNQWNGSVIHPGTLKRIDKIQTGEFDEKIGNRVREKAIHLNKLSDFQGLPLWLASYIVYDRHSEASDLAKWEHPADVERFLKNDFRQHALRNPIVEQVIRETLRVVKDIWQHYGDGAANFFDEIHIELGREMKNPAKKREQIAKKIAENENTNLRIKAILTELKNDGNISVRPYSPGQQEILKLYEEGVYSKEIRKDKLEELDKIRKNAKPTPSEINKYKLWLEQGYISPYTGKMIPLSQLFTTKYQVEHIIPQSRFFDDSLSNKVICESEINDLKGNDTGLEFIIKNSGRIVTLSGGERVTIFTKEAYNQHINSYYSKHKDKQKRLLSEDIPESFINRQLNDTKYISKVIKMLLSRIVREDDEQESTSKHVITLNGAITSRMKQDWGLNDVWNELITPRFERLNRMTDSNDFGRLELKKDAFGNTGKQVFQTTVPDEIARGFNRKRIDHRHHALDALVIACVNRTHINYLNNLNARDEDDKTVKYELRNKICFKDKTDNSGNYQWKFHKPWESFTSDTKSVLDKAVVSFKQNTRVINKTTNKHLAWVEEEGHLQKASVSQHKGDNWAIRKPMHAETVSGKVFLKRVKQNPVAIATVLEKIDLIVDKEIKKKIKEIVTLYPNNTEGLKKYLKANPVKIGDKIIDRVLIYETIEATATRKVLDISFDEKKIEKITDTGIQKILLNHLRQEKYQTVTNESGKKIASHEAAFSEDGLDDLNKNIVILNDGKNHQPIIKVRVFEEGGKFRLGSNGAKRDKYVDTAKGTNLFFAIYKSANGKRDYKTIPLNEVIESQKLGALEKLKPSRSSIPATYTDKNNLEYTLLFYLNPNDLVYVPTPEEIGNSDQIDIHNLTKEQVSRIYRMEKTSGKECYFIQNNIADLIAPYDPKLKFGEFGSQNKLQISVDGLKISESCLKLDITRLGRIKKIYP